MFKIEELKIGAKVISEKLGQESEWKDCEKNAFNMGVDNLVDHIRAEIISLNGLEEVVLTHKYSKVDDFTMMINKIDSSFREFTGKDPAILEKSYEALEETETNWFKMGLKLGLEIEKRKAMITKVGEMNLTPETLQVIKEAAKFIS